VTTQEKVVRDDIMYHFLLFIINYFILYRVVVKVRNI